MKENIFILGDSYSTYKGYIPEKYDYYYYHDNRATAPFIRGCEYTWWHKLAQKHNLNIVMNDSFSGTTICNTVRDYLTIESSFISRIDKYVSENFFEKNKIDKMFIFGGTNDSWMDTPVGTLKYSSWTQDDLKCVLPAFCYLIDKIKNLVKETIVIINTDLKQEIVDGYIACCKKNGVTCIRLKEIDKENDHPTELGMEQIYQQLSSLFE